MAGSTGVAPAYVDLESTRSPIDPPPAFQMAIQNNPLSMIPPVYILIMVWGGLQLVLYSINILKILVVSLSSIEFFKQHNVDGIRCYKTENRRTPNKEFRMKKFSFPSTFIIPCSIFDIHFNPMRHCDRQSDQIPDSLKSHSYPNGRRHAHPGNLTGGIKAL